MLSKFIISILPGVIFCIIFFVLDKNKNKKKTLLLLLLFILGGIGSYITYRFEWHFGSYFPKFKDSNMFQVLIYALFGVAIFEEGYKWLFTSLFTFNNKFKSYFSIIVYSVFCSSGFATCENWFFYVRKGNIDTAISRFFTAVPSHICFAIIMGALLILAVKSKKKIKKAIYYILAMIIPMISHAVYNWFIYKFGLFDPIVCIRYLVILSILCIYICIIVRKKE